MPSTRKRAPLPRTAPRAPARNRLPIAAPPEPALGLSVMDGVSNRLLEAILGGEYGPGARLPSERELSASLGASRVAVREALRRLQEWRIVECRRGSGTTVRPRRSWTGMALGAGLSHALASGDLGSGVALVEDALAIRRNLLLEMIERAGPLLVGSQLEGARERVRRAWARRSDPGAFLVEDREVIPSLLEEAGLLASLWTLNSLADSYLTAMAVLPGRFAVPASYPAAMNTMIAALETGSGAEARRALARFLDDLDQGVAASLPKALERRLHR